MKQLIVIVFRKIWRRFGGRGGGVNGKAAMMSLLCVYRPVWQLCWRFPLGRATPVVVPVYRRIVAGLFFNCWYDIEIWRLSCVQHLRGGGHLSYNSNRGWCRAERLIALRCSCQHSRRHVRVFFWGGGVSQICTTSSFYMFQVSRYKYMGPWRPKLIRHPGDNRWLHYYYSMWYFDLVCHMC